MNARLWSEGEPLQMTCDEHGKPLSFRWGQRLYQVEQVCNRWRVHEEWWKEPALERSEGEEGWREYVKVATADGLLCLLACDLHSQTWWLVRLYD